MHRDKDRIERRDNTFYEKQWLFYNFIPYSNAVAIQLPWLYFIRSNLWLLFCQQFGEIQG